MKTSAATFALLAIALGAMGQRFEAIHAGLGIAAVVLSGINALKSRLALVSVALGLAECVFRGEILHACLAPLFFAGCVVNAQSSALRLNRALLLPVVVIGQIALGAAYRHKAIGVMPHLVGALLTAGLVLVVCMIVLQRPAQSAPMRSAAVTALGIVLLQVSLGIAVFVMRLLDADTSPAFGPLAAAHVTVGALTLAAATVLALRGFS